MGGRRPDDGPQVKVERAEKDAEAIRWARAGLTYEQIAQQIGDKDPATAWKRVDRWLKRTVFAEVDPWRRLQLERLEVMWRGIYPAIQRGDLKAIDRGVRILEREARLLGLDSPTQLAVTNEGGPTRLIVEFAEEPDGR